MSGLPIGIVAPASVGTVIFIILLLANAASDNSVRFEYAAQTLYVHKDHTYRFHIRKMGGYYRCYIIRVPQFPGKKPKHYMQGYETDPRNDAQFITWRGEKLTTLDSAKNICRGWANANQLLMDYQRTLD